MSLPNGYRQIPAISQNQGLTKILHLSESGTYYFRVQAIDTAFAGSPFSQECSFTIDLGPEPGTWLLTTTTVGRPQYLFHGTWLLTPPAMMRIWNIRSIHQQSIMAPILTTG
jgi:hypothetical protein